MPPIAVPKSIPRKGCCKRSSSGPCVQFLVLSIAMYVYGIGGGFMFFYIEQCMHTQQWFPSASENVTTLCQHITKLESLLKITNDTNATISNTVAQDTLDQQNIKEICSNGKSSESSEIGRKLSTCEWKLPQIQRWVFFCWVTITTIGYGDITPTTDLGKMLIIPYSLIGIPLVYAFLGISGFQIKLLIAYVNELIDVKVCRQSKVHNKEFKVLVSSMFIVLICLLIGMALSSLPDYGNLRLLDGFYFWYISLSTIGFGDFHIVEDYYFVDNWMQMFQRMSVFLLLLFGLSVLATTLYAISDFINSENKIMQVCKCCRSQTLHLHSSKPYDDTELTEEFTIKGTSFRQRQSLSVI